MTIKRTLSLCLALSVSCTLPLLLSACDTTEEETPLVADNPPPQDMPIEIIPVIDSPQTQVWRPGYWALSGTGFSWVQGKVIARPAPTAVWAAGHWVEHSYGWSFEQGHWE